MQRVVELRRVNANLEEFTCAAAHDLKSPLRGVSDLVEWIAEDLGGTESQEVSRNLGRIRDRVRRLESVIDELLAYARAGTACTDTVHVDLDYLLAGILELLPRPPGLVVSLQIGARPFVTHKAPLESVLRNLIDNAIKHHDLPTGRITIGVTDVGRYCVFTVADDGPGITETREHSGIGLAMSKRLVEAHGGKIELDSKAGVRGSAFQVWWPRIPLPQTAAAPIDS
jgi:signal transduction histidine kinase